MNHNLERLGHGEAAFSKRLSEKRLALSEGLIYPEECEPSPCRGARQIHLDTVAPESV
jgi:hypothetical protein